MRKLQSADGGIIGSLCKSVSLQVEKSEIWIPVGVRTNRQPDYTRNYLSLQKNVLKKRII
jgi:hypothetical protein